MNLLLDTHVLLWWLHDDATLAEGAREAIADGTNMVFVSVVALWEMRIKETLGKLTLPATFEETLAAQPLSTLDVKARHVHALKDLPLLHRDPFDRLLITQAMTEKLTLVTRDETIMGYEVACLQA